jgi:2-haloacid dehalogenase
VWDGYVHAAMKHRPRAVAFDVIETLFALDPIRAKLKDAGLPGDALQVWYARTLRDGIALTLVGQYKSFPEVASSGLRELMAEHSISESSEMIEKVMAAFGELPAHPDVRPSLELLRSAGVKAIALTNGTANNTEKLIRKSGLDPLVDRIVSIDEVRQWKPARAVYLQAVMAAGMEVSQTALVAAHAWDVRGAAAAGLITGWLPRQEKRFSNLMGQPDIKGGTLLEVVQKLLTLPTS